MAEHSITTINDDALKSWIERVQHRLLFMAPGVSEPVAESISGAWRRLGPDRTTVILDVDPEVYRLGFGSIEALTELQECALETGGILLHQPGVRIGLLVADDSTIVFSPTPLLVELPKADTSRPNAIVLGMLPPQVANDLGLGDKGDLERTVGLDPVKQQDLQKARKDLETNPPVQFDVASIERVFNARFEFVEFEVKNCLISRKTVPIPSDLMGLARDERARRLLKSSFKVVSEESVVSGDRILQLRKKITDEYLIVLPRYGTVILRSNRPVFDRKVAALKRYIGMFQKHVQDNLQKAMDENRSSLVKALTPAVIASPPSRWTKYLGQIPDERALKDLLEADLACAFGNAAGLMKDMDVSVLYKGVTYEMLTNPDFVTVAQSKLPMFKDLWDEHRAAPETKETQLKMELL